MCGILQSKKEIPFDQDDIMFGNHKMFQNDRNVTINLNDVRILEITFTEIPICICINNHDIKATVNPARNSLYEL